MKKLLSKERNNTYRKFFFGAVAIGVILSIFAALYARGISNILDEIVMTHLLEVSNSSAREVKAKIGGSLQTLTTTATLLTANSSGTQRRDNKSIKEALEIENSHNEFTDMWVAGKDGIAYGTNSKILDISKEEFFLDAINGKSSISVMEDEKLYRAPTIVYGVPIKGKNGVVGLVLGTKNEENYTYVTGNNIFNGKGYFNIIDSDGNTIILSNNSNNKIEAGNIFRNIYFEKEEYRMEMIKNLQSNGSGVMKCTIGKTHQIAAYVPTGINDWYILGVSSEEGARGGVANILTATLTVCIFMVVSALVFFIYMAANQIRNTRKIERLAYVDELTGGMNLNKFKIEAADKLDNDRTRNSTLVRIDIDNFKLVNDMYGFEEGNKVLIDMDLAIKKVAGTNSLSARISNDDFIVMTQYEDDEDIVGQELRFRENFRASIAERGKSYRISISTGIYKIPIEEKDILKVIDRATMAHKAAKQLGSGTFVIYDDNIRDEAIKVKNIENTMVDALQNGDFVVYMQPKYNLITSKMVGAESLVRWTKPPNIVNLPSDFIPVFEKNGFVINIDLFVLEQVCKMQRQWIDRGMTPVTISVNQSKLLITTQDYVEKVYNIAKKYDIPTCLIELELTETIIHDDIEALHEITKKLQKLGFSISIDDFGSGYSSLNMLKEINANVLKIDREFLNRAEDNERGEIVLSNIIRLAKELKMIVVTEGVETIKQKDLLCKLECDIAQGFLYARPMPINEFEKRLE